MAAHLLAKRCSKGARGYKRRSSEQCCSKYLRTLHGYVLTVPVVPLDVTCASVESLAPNWAHAGLSLVIDWQFVWALSGGDTIGPFTEVGFAPTSEDSAPNETSPQR
jgi:hypothetical protein